MESNMARHERITFDPAVMFGKPIVKGTRITVEQILCKLAAGLAPEGIVLDHPKLTVDDIRAAEAFAADYLADEVIAFG
jgi:uncharacterized protein (DUF433 family)